MTGSRAYPAEVMSVHDGDTIRCDIDLQTRPLGLVLWARDLAIRLAGCNARELTEPGGPEAQANLAALLPPGTPVAVTPLKVDDYGGRVDATVTLLDGSDLVSLLIAGQWAAPWNGRGAKPVPPWPRTVPAEPWGHA